MKTAGPSMAIEPMAPMIPRATTVPSAPFRTGRSTATRIVATSAATSAAAGEHALGDEPAPTRCEGLDQDADAGDAEDDEHRRQLGVLDGRLDEVVHWSPPSAATSSGTVGAFV